MPKQFSSMLQLYTRGVPRYICETNMGGCWLSADQHLRNAQTESKSDSSNNELLFRYSPTAEGFCLLALWHLIS
jgi:hypothetical protein